MFSSMKADSSTVVNMAIPVKVSQFADRYVFSGTVFLILVNSDHPDRLAKQDEVIIAIQWLHAAWETMNSTKTASDGGYTLIFNLSDMHIPGDYRVIGTHVPSGAMYARKVHIDANGVVTLPPIDLTDTSGWYGIISAGSEMPASFYQGRMHKRLRG